MVNLHTRNTTDQMNNWGMRVVLVRACCTFHAELLRSLDELGKISKDTNSKVYFGNFQ